MSETISETPRDHMPTQLITLADLIRDHKDRTGESYNDIARRAELSKAKIGQVATTTLHHMPRWDTIERLAKGLSLPVRVVKQAALASAGITPEEYNHEQRVDILASLLREFSQDDLETCAAVIHAIKERRDKAERPPKPVFK